VGKRLQRREGAKHVLDRLTTTSGLVARRFYEGPAVHRRGNDRTADRQMTVAIVDPNDQPTVGGGQDVRIAVPIDVDSERASNIDPMPRGDYALQSDWIDPFDWAHRALRCRGSRAGGDGARYRHRHLNGPPRELEALVHEHSVR
jgi:hypothetical protein